MIVVDGQGLYIKHEEDLKAIKGAFEWANQSVMYDKNLKKIKRGE